jgi:hypothetical protein
VDTGEADYEWPNDQGYFEEYNTKNKRFARVWTPTKKVIGDFMELYLARYEREENSIPQMNILLESDEIQWKTVESLADQYRIFLNDSLIEVKNWVQVKSGHTGQKALMSQLATSHLPAGIHEIRIEKLIYLTPFLTVGNELRHRKKWARFQFIKE